LTLRIVQRSGLGAAGLDFPWPDCWAFRVAGEFHDFAATFQVGRKLYRRFEIRVEQGLCIFAQ